VARGARVNSLWQAAALGDCERVTEFLNADPAPTQDEIDEAFFQACHGGQLRVAALLLERGADINSTPDYGHGQTPLDIARSADTRAGSSWSLGCASTAPRRAPSESWVGASLRSPRGGRLSAVTARAASTGSRLRSDRQPR
jgi:Ankyrin repeats (many copies)